MNLYKDENTSYCYFHPKEIFVGVCPLCLNERLLVVAAKRRKNHSSSSSSSSSARGSSNLRPTINFPKIFAFSSLLNRLEIRPRKSDNHSDDIDASTSQEDSFISIKFEDNGNASWEKSTVSKVSLEHCSVSWNHHTLTKEMPKEAPTSKSVIEHQKSRVAPLRWRKRIGHLFQLIRLKRSSTCHVAAKVEGVKVRKQGWTRTLTKRKPKN